MNIINRKRNLYKIQKNYKEKTKTQIENNRKQRRFQIGNKKRKYFIKVEENIEKQIQSQNNYKNKSN